VKDKNLVIEEEEERMNLIRGNTEREREETKKCRER
jgi:hypothetical protein